MPTRLSLRRVGASVGKLALSELLDLATRKLKLPTRASNIYTATGDEVDEDDDVLLLREDELLYVSCGEPFSPPEAAAVEPLPLAAEPPRSAVPKPSSPATAEEPTVEYEPPPAAADLLPPRAAAEPAATEPSPPVADAVEPVTATRAQPFDVLSLDDGCRARFTRSNHSVRSTHSARSCRGVCACSEDGEGYARLPQTHL